MRLLLVALVACAAAQCATTSQALLPPEPLAPLNATAATVLTHPHLNWTASCTPVAVGAACEYLVEIAQSVDFAPAAVVARDVLPAVITRYVPVEPLAPGVYYWRVGAVPRLPGDHRSTPSAAVWAATAPRAAPVWSAANRFTVRLPLHTLDVPANATLDDIHAIWSRVQATGGDTLVRFNGGDRRLAVGAHTSFVNLTAVSRVVIDGGNASLTFTDGFLVFVQLTNCQQVEVRGMAFDFDPLPYTALRIDGFSAPNGSAPLSVTVERLPGHPPLDLNELMANYGLAEILDPRQQPPRVKRGAPLVFYFSNWTRLAAGPAAERYRLMLPPGTRTFPENVGLGDVLAVDPRIARGYFAEGGADIVFDRLVAYAVSNEALTSAHCARHAILRSGFQLKAGRFLAANNGGHNHHSARTSQWIEGCDFHNSGDDMVNTNIFTDSVSEPVAPDSTVLYVFPGVVDIYAKDNGRDMGMRVGDRLQFYNFSAGVVLGTRRVAAVGRPDPAHDMATRVELDAPLGFAITPGVIGKGGFDPLVTQVINLDMNSQFVFRNNRVINARRVSVLAHGQGGWVQNNTFHGGGGGAVELWNDPFEGLCGSSYLIEDNLVNDTNQLARYAAPIWTQRFGNSSSPNVARPCADINIRGNTFRVGPGSMLILNDVSSASITNNTFERCAAALDPSPLLAFDISTNISMPAGANTVMESREAWLCDKGQPSVQAPTWSDV